MAVSSFSRSTVTSNLPRFNDMLVTNESIAADAFQLIESQTVGAGGVTSLTFSSIPQTYKHLQVRCIARVANSFTVIAAKMNFNSDTSSNYTLHRLIGNGSAASSDGYAGQTNINLGLLPAASSPASVFGGIVCDILDYASTSKNKTIRALAGVDQNNADGRVTLQSGAWLNSSTAITSITIDGNASFVQHSTFALYGVR